MDDLRRPILAILVAACLVFAAAATWVFDNPTVAGFSLRSGVLLAAFWLAWPELTTRSFKKTFVIALGVVLVFLRPRAAWFVIPAFLVWLGTSRR